MPALSLDDYYRWREFEARLGGQHIRYAAKPGLPDWDVPDHAARLLANSIEVGQGDQIVDLRSGKGILAAILARRGAQVTVQEDHIVAAEATRRTLALNDVSASSDRPPDYGVAVLTLPKGRDALRYLAREAARLLRPGGRLYLAGANRAGIKSAIDDLRSIFGNAQALAYGKGYRVVVSTRPESLSANADDGIRETEIDVRGLRWRIASAPGVFAHGRLDDGTRGLLEAIEFRAGESLLDLGCGSGIIGLVAARHGNQVTCVDASALAVAATRRTLAINGIDTADVRWSDCASAVMDRQFDVVATNPPFHQGIGTESLVARQFVRDAACALHPGGRLVLVANWFLRYEQEMGELFSSVRVIHEDGRYRVFEATA